MSEPDYIGVGRGTTIKGRRLWKVRGFPRGRLLVCDEEGKEYLTMTRCVRRRDDGCVYN